MRVISQDGTMDMPYEMSIIWSEDNGAVLLQAIGEAVEYQSFAKYSTEEKAKKAMELLRNKYMEYTSANYLKVYQFPTEEELE